MFLNNHVCLQNIPNVNKIMFCYLIMAVFLETWVCPSCQKCNSQQQGFTMFSWIFFLQTDKMVVAITGATGFIGLRLVERFDAGNAAK
jgi:hypothetical protein